MKERKIGVLLTYIHIFLINTVSLIYTPYMLKMMGQNEYGLYGTAASFISYLSILNFGIGGAYVRLSAKYRANDDKDGENTLNGMFLIIFSFLALLVLVVGVICIVFVDRLVENTFTYDEIYKLRLIMIILVINMVITFICNIFTMVLQAYEKYIFLKTIILVAGILSPIINVLVLNFGGKSVSITFVSLIISILSYFFYIIYAKRIVNLKFNFKSFDREVLNQIFVFSGFLFLDSITDQITFSTDPIILSSLVGPKSVAVYTVGTNFKNYFLQFSSAVSGVFGSSVNMMVARECKMEELDEVFIKVGRIQFYVVALVLIGYLAIGKSFVMLWAGIEYLEAFYIGLLLMLSIFVPAFQNIGIEIQKAMNKHKVRSTVYFFIALANVFLTIPLCARYGAIGAALATLISMFVGRTIFMNWYYGKIGLNITRFWFSIISILLSFVPTIFVAFAINKYFIINSFFKVLIAALLISIVYIISIWNFAMNESEKNLIKSFLKKKF